MDEIRAFISGYQPHDWARIQFKWNGKHGDEFRDENEAFRSKVFEAVVDDIAVAPILLVRDVFCAETQWAVEAWCIKDDVNVLAEHLLRRGGTTYLDDYLEGKFACFDANLGTAFGWDRTLLTTLMDEVRARLAANPSSPKADLWRQGEALFATELGGATS